MKYLSGIIAFLLLCAVPFTFAEAPRKEKKWWEKRNETTDLFFPHNSHMEVMEERGDMCMTCHPYSKNEETNPKIVEHLNIIANEPLEAICHSCHVEELSAASECFLCHKDVKSVWPDDHNFNYKANHSLDGSLRAKECEKCHVNPSFCTDCHFRRDQPQDAMHGIGYRGAHGIEARISPGQCAKCHNRLFCLDCHEK